MKPEDFERLKAAYPFGEDPDVGFAKAVGVHTPAVRRLYNEIYNDLDDTIFGVRWWATHPGTTRRILISHYVVECIRSIETNLIEASLHRLEVVDYCGRESDFLANSVSMDPSGKISVRMPRRATPEEDLPHRIAALHLIGFFRALVGALDCVGAAIVTVLALPVDLRVSSLRRAQDALKRAAAPLQVHFREKLDQIIVAEGPTGWLEWMIDFRNMVVHRGRRWHMNELLPRPERLFGPDGRVILRMMVVEHLPSDPDRSQVEALVDPTRTAVLTEDAAVTMRGVLGSSLKLIEEVAGELVEVWTARRRDPALLIQPREQWPNGLCVESTGFAGYRPGSFPYDPDLWVGNPDLARQFRTAALADDLRARWQSFD